MQQITVDPTAIAYLHAGIYKLPEKSHFKRCYIVVDVSDRRLAEGRTGTYAIYDQPMILFPLLVEDLKTMSFFEVLRLPCKRARIYCFEIF